MEYVFTILMIISGVLLIAYLKSHWFQEKTVQGPETTIPASVVSKEIVRGTHRSGRSKGGYSYVVHFLTDSGQPLELFTYELEFGGLKEGSSGILTYKGRYFVCFQTNTPQKTDR